MSHLKSRACLVRGGKNGRKGGGSWIYFSSRGKECKYEGESIRFHLLIFPPPPPISLLSYSLLWLHARTTFLLLSPLSKDHLIMSDSLVFTALDNLVRGCVIHVVGEAARRGAKTAAGTPLEGPRGKGRQENCVDVRPAREPTPGGVASNTSVGCERFR